MNICVAEGRALRCSRPAREDRALTSTTRSYHSPLRARRAADNRRRVIESAAALFSARGYAGATVAAIAEDAEVSSDTVTAVGSKAYLLLEAFRTRYTGEGGWESVLEQPVTQEIFAITDPEEAIARLADFLVRAHQASADLWLALRATALVEPLVADGFAELSRFKAESFEATTQWLLRIGVVVPVPETEVPLLAAAVNLVMSAETYLQLTRDYGFTEEQYRSWLRRALLAIRA